VPIVFDEIQGVVTPDSEPQESALPLESPAPPLPPDPEEIARAIRILNQRKARLFAD
jgi:hypothetical protein